MCGGGHPEGHVQESRVCRSRGPDGRETPPTSSHRSRSHRHAGADECQTVSLFTGVSGVGGVWADQGRHHLRRPDLGEASSLHRPSICLPARSLSVVRCAAVSSPYDLKMFISYSCCRFARLLLRHIFQKKPWVFLDKGLHLTAE